MKTFLTFVLCTCSFFLFSQEKENSIYFPQEQIIHPDCENSADTNKCLNLIVLKMLRSLVDTVQAQPLTYKDTLQVKVVFSVSLDGTIMEKSAYNSINDSIIRKSISDSLTSLIYKMPILKLKNRKAENYRSVHEFNYDFRVREDMQELELLVSNEEELYTGGYVLEMPLFEGCERIGYSEDRSCVQTRMQEHVMRYFKYPLRAEQDGIEGKVFINFTIDEDGRVKDISTRGPHPILEKEALRIIGKLEKFQPGFLNGKPKSILYTVPITFKLQ